VTKALRSAGRHHSLRHNAPGEAVTLPAQMGQLAARCSAVSVFDLTLTYWVASPSGAVTSLQRLGSGLPEFDSWQSGILSSPPRPDGLWGERMTTLFHPWTTYLAFVCCSWSYASTPPYVFIVCSFISTRTILPFSNILPFIVCASAFQSKCYCTVCALGPCQSVLFCCDSPSMLVLSSLFISRGCFPANRDLNQKDIIENYLDTVIYLTFVTKFSFPFQI
jgi:hypothetical protein